LILYFKDDNATLVGSCSRALCLAGSR